jgi:hypothetical protein
MNRLVRMVQRVRWGSEARLARKAHAERSVFGAANPEEAQRFRAAYGVDEWSGTTVLGGAVQPDGSMTWIGLPTREFVRLHGLVRGATGGGKTFWILGAYAQVMRDGIGTAMVDCKSETADLLTKTILPALITQKIVPEAILDKLHVIAPFDPSCAPHLNVTLPEPGVTSEVQALSIVEAIQEAMGENLSGRTEGILLNPVKLAIILRRPLTHVRTWLADPAKFARDALSSGDPELCEYVRTAHRKTHQASVAAAVARMDQFLFLRQVRDALESETCVDFREILATGHLIAPLGDPPSGLERLTKFWGALIMGRVQRAILSREEGSTERPVWMVVDEVQEILTPGLSTAFERLLSLARFKSVGLVLANQLGGQLSSVDPLLTRSLETNVGFEARFRSSREDAKLAAASFPLAWRAGRTRDDVAEFLATLPDRSFLLALRKSGFRPQLLRSPRLDMQRLRAAAEKAPLEFRGRIERGVAMSPRKPRDARRVVEMARPTLLDLAIPSVSPESPSDDLPRLG